jgi:phosphoglycerol transferase
MTDGHFLPFAWKSMPDCGAPGVSNLNFGPTTDEALNGLFGLLVRRCGLFPGYNLGVLIGHVAAGAVFYLVARRGFDCAAPWAFVGGLAFGLAPYQFAQEPHHVNCQYVWHLPLFPLVWKWIAAGRDLALGTRRLSQAMAIGLVTGLQNPYYSNIFCQLVLVSGLLQAWNGRSWARLKPVAAIIAAVAIAFFLSNLDTLTYRTAHAAESGAGSLVANREYKWMDVYGFKIVDLFIPQITHRSAAMAGFGLGHRQASVLNDEEGSGYIGLLGIGCLLFLAAAAVRAIAEGRSKDVPVEAWWVLWVVLMFNTGGLNSTIAAFTGFTLFRTGIRYSIVILLVSLFYAAGRMTAWHLKVAARMPAETLRIATLTASVGGCLLVLWDQVPRSPTPRQVAAIADAVSSDRDFVAAIEATLPPGPDGRKAMVFQLPVMEGVPVPGVATSDHFRPYLYSRRLHYSYGAGGEALAWQKAVQRTLFQGAEIDRQQEVIRLQEPNAAEAVEELKAKGFAAIYVNRNGYPDGGKGLRETMAKLGYADVIESPAGDLMCVPLRKK